MFFTRQYWQRQSLLLLVLILVPAIAPAQVPPEVSALHSYYIPQAGPVSAPLTGADAVRLFRACPNNDGGASLPNSARIRITVEDDKGVPMAGIAAADICIVFNGGTSAQGYSGSGADSVIANSTYNSNPLCPNLTCIEADGPTNAVGITYITFTGHAAIGVGARNPDRKWGHYDSVLPVYVLGEQIFGRFTGTSPPNSYVLQIKNFDWTGGLGTTMNAGERVTITDYNGIANNLGGTVADNPINYWRDFDNDGVVGSSDLNMITLHNNHDCEIPNNP
jgi:hypothetical protein